MDGVSSIQFYFGFFEFVLTLQAPKLMLRSVCFTARNKVDKNLAAVMADILNKGRLEYWSQVGRRSLQVRGHCSLITVTKGHCVQCSPANTNL